MSLISLETTTNPIQNTFDIIEQTANIIKRLRQAVHELGNANSDAPKGNTIQQIDNPAEIGVSNGIYQRSRQTAEHSNDSTGNGLHTIKQALKHLQELTVPKGGIHGIRSVFHSEPKTADSVDDLLDPFLNAPKQRLECLQTGNRKDIAENSDEILNSGHNKTQNIGDALGHLTKNFASLGRIIDAGQEIANRGSNGKDSISKGPYAASHRKNSVDHRHDHLTAQIQDREKAFEGPLQLICRFI